MGKRVLKLLFMFVFLLSGNIYSQEIKRTVTGNVADETGAPLAGVTVKEVGSQNGTATDASGRYTVSCGKSATLVFTFIGYVTQKAQTGNRSIINITMQEDASDLDEVMVVAYGTAKKGSYSGSASLVKEDALKDIPVTTFENALNGKVAGLQITNNSGQAGTAPTIRIRGIGSMNASNSPLYVIDGVPVTSGNVGQ